MNELYEQLKQGDTKAWKQLDKELKPKCKLTVTRRSGSDEDAREIFNQALTALLLRLQRDDLDPVRDIGGYVFRVCRNRWTRELMRKESIEPVDPFIPIEEGEKEEKLRIEHLWSLIYKCMDSVPVDCQKLLSLSFLMKEKHEQLSDREIAEELKIEYNKVRQRRYQCLQRIRNCVNSKL